MAASIRSTVSPVNHPVTGTPRPVKVGESRDDLYTGDTVTVQHVGAAATTYAWTLAFKPEGSTATFAGDPLTSGPLTFNVDLEGPYLIRLTVDLGLPTENSQFVRLRYLTDFGGLKLTAAGEQNNSGVPVPVDATTTGWADQQNFNLQTLLDLVSIVSSSGRVLYVDENAGAAADHGDYDSIQDAINHADTAGATALEPWVVLVRPGLYTEDLTFQPHVHVVGWPGNIDGSSTLRVVRVQNQSGKHVVNVPGASDQTYISSLTFENPINTPDACVETQGPGTTVFHRCSVASLGTSASQGAAVETTGGFLVLDHTELQQNTAAGFDRPALEATSGTNLTTRGSSMLGPSGMSLVAGSVATLRDTRVTATSGAGSAYGIRSNAESLTLDYCTVRTIIADAIQIHPGGGFLAGDVGLTTRWTFIAGGILFDTTGIGGTTTLHMGSTEYATLNFPGSSPSDFAATTKARSLFYDNTTTGISAENVQDAIDEVYAIAAAVQTLDDAYDGGLGAGGTGRDIVADDGPVRILDAPAPSGFPTPANPDGRIQVVGGVEVGAIDDPEILLDPNHFGNGPLLYGGRFVAAGNAPFGSTFMVRANSTGFPDFNNYNLRLLTESTHGGSRIGKAIIRGGDAFDNGGATPSPGPIWLQAGSAFGGTVDGRSIILIPGGSVGGDPGSVILANPSTMTPATLIAANPFVGGVTGIIRFATNMGAIELSIDAADNLAAVHAKFNATRHVTAAGNPITLTTIAQGPNAEIFFLNDDQGLALDTALGTFDGVSQVNGTAPESIKIRVTADQTIEFGVDGASGPMIYDADAGKLTVPVTIDPIYLVMDVGTPVVSPSGKGILFVGDGTGGTILGNFYFRYEGGAIQDISAAVGGATGFSVEDEGISVPGGPHSILNFTGAAVTASDAGGGRVNVAVTAGGGTVAGVTLQEFPAASFVFGGGVSAIGLSDTPDTNLAVRGLYELLRNGVDDMDLVASPPSTSTEYAINGGNLEIGGNITSSKDTYRLRYPRT
jgi:hypothetical protein